MARHELAPPLILSLGDPAGVGPELIAAAWAAREAEALPAFAVVGDARCLEQAATTRGIHIVTREIAAAAQASEMFSAALPVIPSLRCAHTPGTPGSAGASAALLSLEEATRLVRENEGSALVTAPVSKHELVQVGFGFPGQTEFLAERCGIAWQETVMILAGPSLRTVPLTIHCALADVPGKLSTDLIVSRAQVTANALQRDFGIPQPRLAIAGLNPHAGENGAFGDEEARIIEPAIKRLLDEGFDVSGPHAADALFTPHKRGSYDAALCMYHDQALVPVKALDFDQGVNCTLGLPIIRTSPDHGTAFDIAGKNTADPGALIAAIRLAGEMAVRRAHG